MPEANTLLPQHVVDQFGANVRMLAEQTMSRLLAHVNDYGDITGEAASIDRTGSMHGEPEEVLNALQRSNLSEVDHDRRWMIPRFWNKGFIIEKLIKIALLTDPQGRYTQRQASVFGRFLDDTIIDAAFGNAYEGKKSGALTAVPLPAAQKVAASDHGDGRLNVRTLQEVKAMFQEAEYMDQGVTGGSIAQAICIASPTALTRQLISETQVSSADYNTIRALVNGETDTYMGFRFYATNRLPKSGNDRKLLFFVPQRALEIGWAQRMTTTQSVRPDIRNQVQVLTEGGWAVTRCEDEAVIEVTIDESIG